MKQAFTLIELLVVVLIIGILSAVALPQYQKAVMKTRATEAFVALADFQRALDVYILENGFTTTTLTGEDQEEYFDTGMNLTPYYAGFAGGDKFVYDAGGDGDSMSARAIYCPNHTAERMLEEGYCESLNEYYVLTISRDKGTTNWQRSCSCNSENPGSLGCKMCATLRAAGWN